MSGRESWTGYSAALWAAMFAALHVVWAGGWYVGLPRELAHRAFQQRWFLLYDLLVAAVCAAGAWVALALVQPWGLQLPRRLLLTLASGGTGLLVLRGGAGGLQAAYHISRGERISPAYWVEIWFCLGALLFGLSIWHFIKRSARQ